MVLQRSPKQLAKLIEYILRRRPDEFGLVTDGEGFVKIKELLKALNEEDGLKYVRHSHINEIMISLSNHGFEVVDKLIRAQDRERLPKQSVALNPPKLLFTCVRRKAYPYVLNRGIKPTGFKKIILSSSRDLAQRIGRRSDHAAVMLTVQVSQSEDKGVIFIQAGETLFLADYIPPDCFSGPPLSKELPEFRKPDKPQKEPAELSAGSFLLDPNKKEHPAKPGITSKKRSKKHKRRRERPPWRR
jgi:putative RNA 2'-phosphotransferase